MNVLGRFTTIWHVDFEYRQDSNALPVPVCMCAIEQRTGTRIEMWRDELLRCRRAPFDTGSDSVMVAYMAAAELSCFLALGWRFPINVCDLYIETIVTINGDDSIWLRDDKRPSLQEALQLHGLGPKMTEDEKTFWRRMILDNIEYDNDQKLGIQAYNRTDIEETLALIEPMATALDIPHALHRARFMGAVAHMEATGLPISSFIPSFFEIKELAGA
jgi:DNA polymerase I